MSTFKSIILMILCSASYIGAFQHGSRSPYDHNQVSSPRRGINLRKTKVTSTTNTGAMSPSTTRTTSLASVNPSSSILTRLPVCAHASSVLQVATISGCIGLAAQFFLYGIFRNSNDPIRKQNAGYTSHSIVALALMILVSWIGVIGWCTRLPTSAAAGVVGAAASTGAASPAIRRLVVPIDEARWLSSIICGMFVIWDIPTSLMIQKLRKPDVIVHHVAMAILAYFGAAYLPMYYLFYFFGISELSSIPLVVYDQLTQDFDAAAGSLSNPDDNVRKLRDRFQLIAAMSFTLVRAISFPIVSLFKFLPDVRSVLLLSTTAKISRQTRLLLKGLSIANISFTILQLYWFSLIVRVATGMNNKEEAT